VDQNFDNYAVEYTFADGTLLSFYAESKPGCHGQFTTYAHGAKGLAVITASFGPVPTRIYKGHRMAADEIVWQYAGRELNAKQEEWFPLIDAIRQDKPFNEANRGAEASLVCAMGRMAAHTGRIVSYQQMLDCPHELAPGLDKMTADSPAPLKPGANGEYPVPQPGFITDREYA